MKLNNREICPGIWIPPSAGLENSASSPLGLRGSSCPEWSRLIMLLTTARYICAPSTMTMTDLASCEALCCLFNSYFSLHLIPNYLTELGQKEIVSSAHCSIFSQFNINSENSEIQFFCCNEGPPLLGHCGCHHNVICDTHLEHKLLLT